ncbi:MAG: two-component system, chemotaxis family, CheB/CheR fusion protein [Verrucomicrobia bacterium]|nr:MAG: two-component system, chemotaxis family, CheB/CheR fusion protein [Verrucomicrobiota bacterium]
MAALEQFFLNLPAATSLAYVVVQHLEPDREDMLPELLGRDTSLQVIQAQNGMRVRPGLVYVIPPNAELSILHGWLQVRKPAAPRGHRLPIDSFLRDLAKDQREKAIAIILSGMGSDGALGIKAIKKSGGMVLVQDPASAKFDSMPRSAIRTGLVDCIAAAEDLPTKLLQYVTGAPSEPPDAPSADEKPWTGIDQIFGLLREQTGNDFSSYKTSTIHRRIERRMMVHQFARLAPYIRFLQENPHEVELLHKEMLIGVTEFFRDPGLFETLKEKIIPGLLTGAAPGRQVRIWTPGCSTGEESYSLAILFQEYFEAQDPPHRNAAIQIFATDLDRDAIDRARRGLFSEQIRAQVSPERLERFFVPEGDRYRIKKEIREMLVFAPHNLLTDPPFTKLDLISCRNVLIYLKAKAQRQLLPLMHFALNPGGLLILGTAESTGGSEHLFATVDKKWIIFRSKELSQRPPLEFPLPQPIARPGDLTESTPEADLIYATQQALLDEYAPPAVVVTLEGDIVYVNGRTGKFLEPASGKMNHNLFAMAREGLREEIGSALRTAGRHLSPVTHHIIQVPSDGSMTPINLSVKPLPERISPRRLFLVVFEECKTSPAETDGLPDAEPGSVDPAELQSDLHRTRQRLLSVTRQMESTQEALKAANEELQSNNEELQSANEELNSSKEELQSINEEMQTVNAELQTKIDELSGSNNDIKNLLNGIEMATIFLNVDLGIKRFTPQSTKIVHLLPGDVGRSISDFATQLKYGGLIDDARKVLGSLEPRERQVEAANGCWYNMRILPYRTTDNVIDGVVVTFADITALKNLEQSLRIQKEEAQAARRYAETILATVREPLVVLDESLRILFANQCFYDTFRVTPGDTKDQLFYEISQGQWDVPPLRQLLEDILPHQTELRDFRVEHDFLGCGRKVLLLNARRMASGSAQGHVIMLAMEDVTGPETNTEPARK